MGKPVILRVSAESGGDVVGFAVDAPSRRVVSVLVRSGRATGLVDWSEVQSIGPDAVIARGVREPTDDDDRAISHALHPVDKRVLSDLGNDLGPAHDVTVDDDGTITSIELEHDSITGARLRGIGSYAVVVAADPSER
jgi:hypothetical protein